MVHKNWCLLTELNGSLKTVREIQNLVLVLNLNLKSLFMTSQHRAIFVNRPKCPRVSQVARLPGTRTQQYIDYKYWDKHSPLRGGHPGPIFITGITWGLLRAAAAVEGSTTGGMAARITEGAPAVNRKYRNTNINIIQCKQYKYKLKNSITSSCVETGMSGIGIWKEFMPH